MHTHELFIGGRWIATPDTLPVIDPSDGAVTARLARGRATDIDAAVQAGQAALDGEWGRLDAAARGRLMSRMAELIRRDI